jgi:signal transduction histidine kinase
VTGDRTHRLREALAAVEEQRDDALVYLSAIKLLLEVVARGHATPQCAQEIAETLVQQLALETCAVALYDPASTLGLAGFATQSQRLGGTRNALEEAAWVTLARLVNPGVTPSCFRRLGDGSFKAVAVGELDGEGFLVLPFAVGGEAGGALVLHSLVAPAQTFARPRALALVGDIVGQALTIAGMRESVVGLCTDLESELGVTRRALSDQQRSLRAHEENIQDLTQALIRSNRVKREFLGAVSHELRTPLNAILGYTSLVREGMVGAVSGEQASILDRVLSNTRNLNWLIDDILFFVQAESERVAVRPEELRVVEVIDAVVEELPDIPGKPRVPLRVAVAPAAQQLRVDGALVRRILFHLLGNAFKFTATGEVTVSVRPGDELGSVVIAVRDTGIGMPRERIEHLFELFAQADSSTTRRYNGLGMGLTLVQRCVRLLHGDVAVESEQNVGTEFRVRIPAALSGADDAVDAPDAARTVH